MKKAFTLIELLAVIIILAIIALIATPMILDVVDNVKTTAAETEARLIVKSVNQYCELASFKASQDSSFVNPCADGEITNQELKEMVDNHMLIRFTDKDGKTCDENKSYVEVTKISNNEYTLKVQLKCGGQEDYILEKQSL